MNRVQSENLSIKVYEAWVNKEEFNRPAKFCDLLESTIEKYGVYPIYANPQAHGIWNNKKVTHDPKHFVRFLTREQLFTCDFPEPKWQRTTGRGILPKGKAFDMEFADVYAGYPKCAVYRIEGRYSSKTKEYEYRVEFFRDGHISNQEKTSRRPLNLKALVEELRAEDLKHTYHDGTWAY